MAGRGIETDDLTREILWLYLPDLRSNGQMKSIEYVKSRDGKSIFWKQHPDCSGFTVSDKDCPYRTSEMDLMTYTPIQCRDASLNCDQLVAYVRFNTQG